MKLSDLPIDRPVACLMLLLSLTVLGAVSVFQLPLDSFPYVEPPVVEVRVPFPGSHPLEGLRDIIQPLEEEIASIPELEGLRSDARSDEITVRASFGWSVNVELKKLEVREAVERVKPQLPEGIGYVRIQSSVDHGQGGRSSILRGRISARRNLSESWDLLDRHIRRPLERIQGVARVDLDGVASQQVRVDLDPGALRRHGIEPARVLQVLRAANVDLDLGAVRGDLLRYDVRALGRFRSTQEIRDVPLGAGGLRLGDVARVELREPELPYGRHLNREFAVGIDVFKEPTANTVETVDELLARIEDIRRDPALEGIDFLIWNNSADEIRLSLAGLRNAGLFGGLLAIIVLYLFLRKVSTTLIVATAIPFSLLVTCGGMFFLDMQFNVLTLLGLMFGVGMLVDNAVVVMENIYRRQSLGMPARDAARIGAREVSLAVLASTATTVIVWSWLFVADRDPMTIFMGQMAATICLAVGCSLLISLTFIPLAAARIPPRGELREGFVIRRIVPAYRRVLAWTLCHRLATLAGLVGLASSAAIPIWRIEKSGEPKMQERAVSIRMDAVDPASKEVMEGHVDQIEAWVESHKEEFGYESLYSWYTDWGFALTLLYLPVDQANDEALQALRTKLREDLPVIPGVKLEVGERMWNFGRSGGRRMVSVALHGEDPEYLYDLAARVDARLQGLGGMKEVYGPELRGRQEARILVDSARARSLGLAPRAIADTVAFLNRGQFLRRFDAGDHELEMLVGLPEELQPGLDSLDDLPIPGPAGETIPLGSVATIQIEHTYPEMHREDRMTTLWIEAEFDEELTTEDAQARITARLAGFPMPEGYFWDWGQWGRDRNEALGVMLQGVLLSLLIVILLMAALFESFSQPLAILVTLPLAFFGGFWSLWLGGYELEIVGFIGVILLIGIVVNNGIVLIEHVNQIRREGKSREEALLQGCGDRLRPVLMTAITTVVGMLPLLWSGFTVANAQMDALAVVVIGGLTSSTLFTLLALPVWTTTLEDLGRLLARTLPARRGPGVAAAPARGVLAGRPDA